MSVNGSVLRNFKDTILQKRKMYSRVKSCFFALVRATSASPSGMFSRFKVKFKFPERLQKCALCTICYP